MQIFHSSNNIQTQNIYSSWYLKKNIRLVCICIYSYVCVCKCVCVHLHAGAPAQQALGVGSLEQESLQELKMAPWTPQPEFLEPPPACCLHLSLSDLPSFLFLLSVCPNSSCFRLSAIPSSQNSASDSNGRLLPHATAPLPPSLIPTDRVTLSMFPR